MIIRLVLSFILVMAGAPALADADGPDAWRVVGVEAGGVLNMRRGPSIQFTVIATIPHDATGLQNRGCSPDFDMADWARFTDKERRVAMQMRWCRVAYRGNWGWVAGGYLSEE